MNGTLNVYTDWKTDSLMVQWYKKRGNFTKKDYVSLYWTHNQEFT